MSQTPHQDLHQDLHQTLHQQLVDLRGRAKAWLEGETSERFDPDRGICDNLWPSPHCYVLLNDLLASWPGGSGSWVFPVPHPLLHPYEAYVASSQSEKWNPEHEYARSRLALLDWLIEQTAPAN